MADVQPLRALHYDQAVAGPLQALVAPPYDVIDPAQRAGLAPPWWLRLRLLLTGLVVPCILVGLP